MTDNICCEKLVYYDDPSLPFRERVQKYESWLVKGALKVTSSQVQAAKVLKMDRTVLRRLMRRSE